MAMDPLGVWKVEYANMKEAPDGAWAINFADWVAKRVEKMEVSGKAFDFKFNKGVFAARLVGSQIDVAFVAAMNLSSIKPLPPNVEAVFDPGSISAGAAIMKGLIASGAPESDPMKTIFPQAVFSGFKALKVLITDPGPTTAPFPVS